MKVHIVRDSDFTVRDSVPASYLLHYDAYAKRYLSAFDRVILVARLFQREDLTAMPAVGPGVEFVALPGYRGPRAFAKHFPNIVKIIFSTVDKRSCYILRIPATIPIVYSLILWAKRIPFAVEVAADPLDGYSKEALNKNKFAFFFQKFFVWATKWQCKTAIAAAYVTREALQRRYPAASEDRSFSFTSLDLDDRAFASSPRPARTFSPDRLRIVLVGNMQKKLKGHDVLIEALADLRSRGLHVSAQLVGFGESQPMFEEMARGLGVLDRVEFLGKLPAGEQVRKVLDTADLFVLPSRQEGLPRALLEAMARGLPAVATRVGGTPELLDDRALIEPGDALALADKIAHLFSNTTELERLSARNLQVARHYHIDEIRKQRDEFFRFVRESTVSQISRT